MRKKDCTESCYGTIHEIKRRGKDVSDVLVVRYEVDGKQYLLKEPIVDKLYEKIKIGFLPIGYRAKPLIAIKTGIPVMVGNQVKVNYQPEHPENAFLPDNDAKISWN